MDPIPSPEASHSTMNGCEKYGRDKTGHELMMVFISSKLRCANSVHVNAPFLVRSVSGAV